jgi:hypothetical protein
MATLMVLSAEHRTWLEEAGFERHQFGAIKLGLERRETKF